MKLHRDWKKILKHSANIKLVVLAALLSGLEAFIPYLPVLMSIDPFWMAVLTPLTLMVALVARLVVQKSISGDADAGE